MATKHNLTSPAQTEQTTFTRRLLLKNCAAGLGLLALSKSGTNSVLNPHNAPPAGSDAHQMDADPALLAAFQPDSQEWRLFNDLLGPILEFRAYVIEGEKPLDPRRLLTMATEAQDNAYDLHGLMSERNFERNILMAVCDEAEYDLVLNQMYPGLHDRPEPAPFVAEAGQMSPAQTKEWWAATAAKMQRLADQARAMAEAA